jgi:hypothetical protein
MNISILIPRRKRTSPGLPLLKRIERFIVRRYEFEMNYLYYRKRGHTRQNAKLLARDTI